MELLPGAVGTACGYGQINCQQTFTVEKPSADYTVYTFSLNGGSWDSEVQTYSGAVSSANLLSTTTNCWNFVSISSGVCSYSTTTGSPATNVLIGGTSTTVPIPGSTLSKTTEYTYGSYSNLTQIQDWKYYTGSLPTNADRTTTITYLNGTAYINANILNRPASVTVANSSSSTVAFTAYAYDQGSLTSVTGIENHDDTNYGTSHTVRGNLTEVDRYSASSAYVSSYTSYDMTGQPYTTTDPNGNVTTFSYTDAFVDDNTSNSNPPSGHSLSFSTNAFPTTITPALSAVGTTTSKYYWGSGQVASVTDGNGNTAYSHYADLFNRPTATALPNSGWSLATYSSTDTEGDVYTGITNSSPTTSCSGSSGGCRRDKSSLDNMGRVTSQYLVSDPDGQTEADTQYDSDGRVLKASNPYRSTSDSTYGFETPTYDGLNRVTKITHQDGNYATTSYGAAVGSGVTQGCSASTYGYGYPTLVVDEAGNKRQTWTDGFGRLIETDEPNASGTLSATTCYSYDLNNNLTAVLAADGTQTRSNTYDWLSRLTSRTEPETGTTYFYYTTSGSSLCSGDPSAVCRRTDPRSITTTYAYDALNRLTSKTYSDSTPSVSYWYDAATPSGCTPPSLTITNGKGRRTAMCDASGTTAWSYDSVGNILTESRTIASKTNTTSYTYNYDGSVKTVVYPSSRTVSYTEGNAQRPTAATDTSNGIAYAGASSLAIYAPTGAPANIVYGYVSSSVFTGITETRTYNNRLEITGINATSSTATALNLSFSYVSGNNGNLSTQTNNVDSGKTQTYTYDTLNRLLTAQSQATSGGDCWGQSFGNNMGPTLAADALANLFYSTSLQCSSYQPRFTMNSADNNQFTGTGISYDSGGNGTGDSVYSYTFDAENRIITASGMTGGPYCYTYDGNGLRVEKANANGGSCTSSPTVDVLYWRNIAGNTIAETDGTGSTSNSSYHEYIFFAGRRVARSDPSSGTQYYYFADHLGSTRAVAEVDSANSPTDGTVCWLADYYPYGQEINYTTTCSQNYKFTGYERDAETGLDYAFARYYNDRLGRFMSGDPAPGDLSDPQTLNRYAYVRNHCCPVKNRRESVG